MKTLVALLGAALTVTASADTTHLLHPIDPVERLSVTCGCAFTGEAGHESWAPWIYLILDLNGKVPNARVNLGKGAIRLRPARADSLSMYQCAAGKAWVSKWLSKAVEVEAKLRVDRPEEKPCSFEGSITATAGDRSESMPIRGACWCGKDVA